MTGDCLTALVRLVEANPGAGIIQTAPRAAGRDTLYARVQQFATRVYGPLFTAGLHFWQLGESHYWGHNAIIRVAPFMRHCALAGCPGSGALSGEILSHDFVEAALMRRAGWARVDRLRPAGQLRGDAAEPDRRAQARPPLVPGQPDELPPVPAAGPASRASRGVHDRRDGVPVGAAVVRVPAAVHGAARGAHAGRCRSTSPSRTSCSRSGREWRPEWAVALFSATALLLFLPKILARAADRAARARRLRRRGCGSSRACWARSSLSALLAPIRMLFHTQFVLDRARRPRGRWKSPPRDDTRDDTGGDAMRRHGVHTLLGVRLGRRRVVAQSRRSCGGCCRSSGALILSIPLSVYTSRVGARPAPAPPALLPHSRGGTSARRDPRDTPLREARAAARRRRRWPSSTRCSTRLTAAQGTARFDLPAAARATRDLLVERAAREGLGTLAPAERALLIGDPIALSDLHLRVWSDPAADAAWSAARDATRAPPPRPWQPVADASRRRPAA